MTGQRDIAESLAVRVDKLLALARSPNWHEAESSLSKAEGLLIGAGVDELGPATYDGLVQRLAEATEAHEAREDRPRSAAGAPTHAELTAAESARMMEALAAELRAIGQASVGSNSEAILCGVGALALTVIDQSLRALRADPACDPHLGFHSANALVRTMIEHAMPAFLTLTARDAA